MGSELLWGGSENVKLGTLKGVTSAHLIFNTVYKYWGD